MAPRRETNIEGAQRGFGRRSLLAGVASLGALGALAATGCSRVADAESRNGGGLLERLRAQGTVRLGIAGEQPQGYIDKDGNITGEAPEIAKIIFGRLGVPRVQAVPTEFNSLIAGLNSQQFDVVSAGMQIKPDRCAEVIFADPEYQMADGFIVPAGNPKKLRSYKDLDQPGLKVATGVGYAEIDSAKDAGVKQLTLLPDQLAGLLAVEQGRVDVFLGTSVTARLVWRQSRSKRVEVVENVMPYLNGKENTGNGAFAFRKQETRLRDAVNRELYKMKDDGELLRVMRPFGFTEKEMTRMTAAERCEP